MHLHSSLFSNRKQSWAKAVYWYEKAVAMDDEDEGGEYDATLDDPKYSILSRLAEIYHQGGNGISKDCYKAGQGLHFVSLLLFFISPFIITYFTKFGLL